MEISGVDQMMSSHEVEMKMYVCVTVHLPYKYQDVSQKRQKTERYTILTKNRSSGLFSKNTRAHYDTKIAQAMLSGVTQQPITYASQRR